MTNKNIKIAIIDDGIDYEYLNLKLAFNIEVNSELELIEKKSCSKGSHGTVCAEVINKYSEDIEIGSIKILNDSLKGDVNKLCAALKWCTDNDVKIANISLGSNNFKDEVLLREAVNHAAEKGLIMVCAQDNKDYVTYPAAFSNVIGVRGDREGSLLEGQYNYNLLSLDGIDINAFAEHSLKNELKLECSNSYAAPMITAKVYSILLENPNSNLRDIRNKLIENAENYEDIKDEVYLAANPDWVRNAVIFSLGNNLSFTEKYYFKVKMLYQVKGECLLEQIKEKKSDYNDIDTIVIISDKENYSVEWSNIICVVEEYNKNLIILEEGSEMMPAIKGKSSITLWHNKVKDNFIENFVENSGEVIEVPIIVIYYKEDYEIDKFLYNLKNLFREKGFNAFVSKDKLDGILLGLEYIKKDYISCNLNSYLNSIVNRRRVDICILAFNEDKMHEYEEFNSTIGVDIQFYLSPEKICTNIFEMELLSEMNLQREEYDDSSSIFNSIISYYSR